MSIEDAIENVNQWPENQLHFETCPGKKQLPSNGTTAQPPGLTAFLFGGALYTVYSWWVHGLLGWRGPSTRFVPGVFTAFLGGRGPFTWFIP